MTTDVLMLRMDTPMLDAARMFAASGAAEIAVEEEQENDAIDNEARFVALLSANDLIKYVIAEADS